MARGTQLAMQITADRWGTDMETQTNEQRVKETHRLKARVYNPGELVRELARFESGTSSKFHHPPPHPVSALSKATPQQT